MERLAAIERRHHMDAHATTSEEDSPSPGKRRHVQTIIIGLSGPSSSGKTTLARLLREIFNLETPGLTLSLAILHQDDSYKTDKDVPTVTVSSEAFGTRDLQDWDCVGSLDLPLFEHTLTHLLEHGALPWDSVSKEDQNSVGESHVSKRDVEAWKERMTAWLDDLAKKTHPAHPSSSTSGPDDKGGGNDHEDGSNNNREVRIYIVDGFLLYPRPPPTSASAPASASGAPSTTTTITSTTTSPHSPDELNRLYALTHSVMHPKLFIPSTRDQTLARRAARSGYVTLEGFWTDPPGYVEDLVWPNYIRYHSWMYAGGNVDAEVFDEAVCAREGISVCPGGGHWDMHRVLEWAVGRVKQAVEEKV
jgi:nicotinamide/nicotinate riboside kinase